MKLLKFTVSNFRGAPMLMINPQGGNVNIYGPNGAGKTTTEDAFLWLLFGKDSADKKDYDLIPHKFGTTEPNIGCGKEPTVEAEIEYFGKTVKLKKAYLEEWPKKGELKGQYAGSKTHYYVDDLEVKAGEYQQVVSELVDDKLFKLITNPTYFMETLSWQERRETLIKIAGELDVTTEPELAALIGDRPFPNFHALAKQNVKAKQKELDGLPYAITEARRMVPAELPELQDVIVLKADKAVLEEQLLTLNTDDAENARRRERAEVEMQISEARNKHITAVDAENAKINAGIAKLTDEKQENERDASALKRGLDSTTEEIKALVIKKAKKLEEYHTVYDKQWTGAELCPTCGQAMPAEQINAAKATFNKQRSEDLERLKNEGLALKSSIDSLATNYAISQEEFEKLTAKVSMLSARIERGRSMLKPYDFENTSEYIGLKIKLDALAIAANTDTAKQSKIETLNGKIRDIQNRIEDANRNKLIIEQAALQQKRVDDLMSREKEINAELGTWEKAVNLCEKHVKKSAKALEQAVNGKFKIARFQLFTMQKNGEEAECCDVVYPNGSTNLSTGERLQTGIDIINTLTEFYGVDAPIWVDNAEGVTKTIETNSQIIRLFVSEHHTELYVEVEA